jgi:hypothetical protein
LRIGDSSLLTPLFAVVLLMQHPAATSLVAFAKTDINRADYEATVADLISGQ